MSSRRGRVTEKERKEGGEGKGRTEVVFEGRGMEDGIKNRMERYGNIKCLLAVIS